MAHQQPLEATDVSDEVQAVSRLSVQVVDAATLAGLSTRALGERLVLLVDTMEEYAIFLLDPAGNVSSWNPGAQRIKGYTADEIVGQHFSVFYTRDDVNSGKPERELEYAAAHGHCRDDGWRVRKDGSLFWASVVISALVDGDGRLEGFAKVTRDESDRQVAEQYAREVQRLTDREHIAGGLSRSVVHRIFEAGLDLQSARKLIVDPIAAERVDQAIQVLDETINEIRSVVLELETDSP